MMYQATFVTMIILGGISSLAITFATAKDKPETLRADSGLSHDLRLLRKTITHRSSKPPVRASSPDAIKAANRVFSRLKFVGMSKEHVIWILGDPATISDYGIKSEPSVDAPLIYRFDSGRGGYDYHVEFEDGRVSQVQRQGTD